MAIIRKKIKLKELFDKLEMFQEEKIWGAPQSLKVRSENNIFEKVNFLYKTNKRKTIKIKIEDPKLKEIYFIEGFLKHKVNTLNGWKNLCDLNKYDLVETLKTVMIYK